MKISFKKILGLSLLTANFAHTYYENQSYNNTVFVYECCIPPLDVIISGIQSAIKRNDWLTADAINYKNGSQLPFIINRRFPRVQYPTLTYYGQLDMAINEIKDFVKLLERKYGNRMFGIMTHERLNYVFGIIDDLESLRSGVYHSTAYANEYYASHNQTTPVVYVHEHHHYKDGR